MDTRMLEALPAPTHGAQATRAKGRRWGQEGSVALCARCHAEAVADHLFGLPRGESPKAGDGSNP